jgi:dipeptidyl aminopeptidase/acylaminoacyl peptidase
MEETLSTPSQASTPPETSVPQPVAAPALSGERPKSRRRLALIVVIILFFILGAIAIYLFLQNPTSPQNNAARIGAAIGIPSPTLMPFHEMTVPYLRERKYESKLGNREELVRNDAYSSYLTSYTSDGLRINALLTEPTGERPAAGWPAIVFVHGYVPPTEYVTNERYVDYVDYLARNGFVVLKIDLRGHGTSEGEPGGGYYGSDYVVDALNAYAALQAADFVNPKAIGMWGHSMAGNILMRSVAARPDIPAVVIWAGAVYSYEDQRKYGINDNSYRPPENVTRQQNKRKELFEKYGSPSASSPFWAQVAPTNYLQDIHTAIQIDHADDDDVVNIGYSRDLMALLDKTSIPHEFYEYPTGGHNIQGASFTLAMERTVEFFKKYLK